MVRTIKKPTHRVKKLYIRDLLLWWAAVDEPKLVPSIHVSSYCCIGLTALLINLFAFISGFFIGYKSSGNILGGILGGIITGTFVFSIDRYILASETVENESKKEKKFWLRLGLSVCTAIIISTPIEVALFSDSIRLHQIQKLNDNIVQLTQEYKEARKQRFGLDLKTQKLIENLDVVKRYKGLGAQIKAKQNRLALLNQGINTEEMDFMEQLLTNWKLALNVEEHPEHTIVHFGLFVCLLFIDMLPTLLKTNKKFDRYDQLRAKKSDNRTKEIQQELDDMHIEEMQQISNNHVARIHELTQRLFEQLRRVNQTTEPRESDNKQIPISNHQSKDNNDGAIKEKDPRDFVNSNWHSRN
jgi:hypothetical protein